MTFRSLLRWLGCFSLCLAACQPNPEAKPNSASEPFIDTEPFIEDELLRPTCDAASPCAGDELCVAGHCWPQSCAVTVLRQDPKTKECVPLLACTLSPEQAQWPTCDDDPCVEQSEAGCLNDARCQPVYQNVALGPLAESFRFHLYGCWMSLASRPPPQGVRNGLRPKHINVNEDSCLPREDRSYLGCRSLPRPDSRPLCRSLDLATCRTRSDCTETRPLTETSTSQKCWSRLGEPSESCFNATEAVCLMSPACQPVGTRCYCPPGVPGCSCDNGRYMDCERNDHLRRCQADAECSAGERCDVDESCINPRQYHSFATATAGKLGTASCLGACVPTGCAGLGEARCQADPSCDSGTYGTVCRSIGYCSGQDLCGCLTVLVGCGDRQLSSGLDVERSLLVRQPSIVGDLAFALASVLPRLAPPGRSDEFTAALLRQLGLAATLENGAQSKERPAFNRFASSLNLAEPSLTGRLSQRMHTTALINRIDLARPGDCGEARISYALNDGYRDFFARLHLIIELRVPDDGNSCRTVAQRWAELSYVSPEEARLRLRALFSELLAPGPAALAQIRSNELVGDRTWVMRELHLKDGLPTLAPAAQTIDPRFYTSPKLLDWVRGNKSAILAGTAVVPTEYLAAQVTADGTGLLLDPAEPELVAARRALNQQSCGGCHLRETGTPNVHISERLASGTDPNYVPSGKSAPSAFLQAELKSRAELFTRRYGSF